MCATITVLNFRTGGRRTVKEVPNATAPSKGRIWIVTLGSSAASSSRMSWSRLIAGSPNDMCRAASWITACKRGAFSPLSSAWRRIRNSTSRSCSERDAPVYPYGKAVWFRVAPKEEA